MSIFGNLIAQYESLQLNQRFGLLFIRRLIEANGFGCEVKTEYGFDRLRVFSKKRDTDVIFNINSRENKVYNFQLVSAIDNKFPKLDKDEDKSFNDLNEMLKAVSLKVPEFKFNPRAVSSSTTTTATIFYEFVDKTVTIPVMKFYKNIQEKMERAYKSSQYTKISELLEKDFIELFAVNRPDIPKDFAKKVFVSKHSEVEIEFPKFPNLNGTFIDKRNVASRAEIRLYKISTKNKMYNSFLYGELGVEGWQFETNFKITAYYNETYNSFYAKKITIEEGNFKDLFTSILDKIGNKGQELINHTKGQEKIKFNNAVRNIKDNFNYERYLENPDSFEFDNIIDDLRESKMWGLHALLSEIIVEELRSTAILNNLDKQKYIDIFNAQTKL